MTEQIFCAWHWKTKSSRLRQSFMPALHHRNVSFLRRKIAREKACFISQLRDFPYVCADDSAVWAIKEPSPSHQTGISLVNSDPIWRKEFLSANFSSVNWNLVKLIDKHAWTTIVASKWKIFSPKCVRWKFAIKGLKTFLKASDKFLCNLLVFVYYSLFKYRVVKMF